MQTNNNSKNEKKNCAISALRLVEIPPAAARHRFAA